MSRYILDLSGITDKDELYEYLKDELPVPDYTGSNLDAWYDVLMEFGEDWELEFTGMSDVDESMPEYMRKFRKVCKNAMIDLPELSITFDEDDANDDESDSLTEGDDEISVDLNSYDDEN